MGGEPTCGGTVGRVRCEAAPAGPRVPPEKIPPASIAISGAMGYNRKQSESKPGALPRRNPDHPLRRILTAGDFPAGWGASPGDRRF